MNFEKTVGLTSFQKPPLQSASSLQLVHPLLTPAFNVLSHYFYVSFNLGAVSNIRILLKFVWHSSFDKKNNTTNKQPIHVQRQQQQQLLNSTVFPMHNMQFCWLDFRRIFFKLRIVILETWKRDKRDIGIIIRWNWDGYFRKYNRHFAN